MRNLRSQVDAVMVGSGTLRAERLTLGLDDGHGSQPLAVVVSSSGRVPLGHLIMPEGQEVLIITSEAKAEAARRLAGPPLADVLAVPPSQAAEGGLDLARALRQLKAQHGVERLLVEGGPTLNQSLIAAGLVDELFLTVSPVLAGDTGEPSKTILGGDTPLPEPRRLSLVSVYLAGDELFLRYHL